MVQSAFNARNLGLIPGSGRNPGEENDNPLQFSLLENSMDRGALWFMCHGVAKSQTQLSDKFFKIICYCKLFYKPNSNLFLK